MQHLLEERHSYYKRVTPAIEKTRWAAAGVGGGRESGAEDSAGPFRSASSPSSFSSSSVNTLPFSARADEVAVRHEEEEEAEEDGDLELTESERNMLKQENTTLQHNFETLVDKTREIEKQVMEISHLQTLFADRVSQQKEAIEDIHKKAIESVDSVQRGNEYLQSASKSGRDFRVFILIFLLVCSFSLLFLHWYE
jgi:septal ring factor EnvC (AmiA/AmiB activator)